MKLTNIHRQDIVRHGRTVLSECPRTNVAICYYNNLECQSLANEMYGLLVDAGWSKDTRPLVKMQAVSGLPEETGIVVADEPPQEAQKLVKMLKDAGIDAKTRHIRMHKPHESGPSERQGPKRFVGTEELLLEIWPDA